MIKTFDCVQMKDRAGKIISKKLSKMTTTQQLSYWQNRHKQLAALQDELRKQTPVTRNLRKNK